MDTFGHFGICEALIFTSFVVVVVVIAVAILADVFAGPFKTVHLVFGPGINEFHHVNNIVGTSLAAVAARVRWAKRELNEVLGVEQAFPFITSIHFVGKLDQTTASTVLDGIVGNPSPVAFTVQGTGLGKKSLSELGVGLDFEVGHNGFGADIGSKKSKKEGSRTSEHRNLK